MKAALCGQLHIPLTILGIRHGFKNFTDLERLLCMVSEDMMEEVRWWKGHMKSLCHNIANLTQCFLTNRLFANSNRYGLSAQHSLAVKWSVSASRPLALLIALTKVFEWFELLGANNSIKQKQFNQFSRSKTGRKLNNFESRWFKWQSIRFSQFHWLGFVLTFNHINGCFLLHFIYFYLIFCLFYHVYSILFLMTTTRNV